jgi:hypothetical protein
MKMFIPNLRLYSKTLILPHILLGGLLGVPTATERMGYSSFANMRNRRVIKTYLA